MLAISETAAEAISTLLSRGDMPAGAGARIAADGNGQGLELALVSEPGQDDAVVRSGDAVVYLEQQSVPALEDKVLDVEQVTSPAGEDQIQFAIVARPEPDPAP